jgi:hypothetical protein
MPIVVVCLSCGAKMRAPDNAAGKTTECLRCGTALVVPVLLPEAPVPVRAEARPQPAKRVEPPAMRPESRAHERPAAAFAASNTTIIVQQPSRAADQLGIAALVIGAVSCVLGFVPVLGVAMSALGLLLGLGGVVVAILRRSSGVGFCIAGCGLTALSLVFGLAWTSAFMGTMAEHGWTSQRIAPVAAPEKSPLAPTKTESEWLDASKYTIRQGDLKVRITQVIIDRVPLNTITGNSRSKDKLLMVKLELANMSSTKKVEYHSWSGDDISFDRDFATLEDNFGNSYRRISFGLGSYPVGAVETFESIYPNMRLSDVLVFEPPLDPIEYLRLELPAKNFGGTGMLRFQIPKAMI